MPNRKMTDVERAAHSERIKNAYRNNPDYYRRICELNRNRKYKGNGGYSETTRKKMSESAKRRHKNNPMPKETREKMSASAKRRSTPEYCNHIREVMRAKKRGGHGERKSRSREEFQKMMQKRWSDPVYRERRILELTMMNNNIWYGGITYPGDKWFEKHRYCHKFNPSLKERVRAFFGYQCAECGDPQNGTGLDVHHVNERKDACCNQEVKRLFVPLCRSCHGHTRRNPPYWKEHFTSMINNYYGGKCYFEREEFWELNELGLIRSETEKPL